jgi:fibronectin-binding autotransporter adhesin
MPHSTRSARSTRARKLFRTQRRSWFLSTLLASLGLASNFTSPSYLYAQNVNNSSTKSLQTNAVENAAGAYNNLSSGILNFNGPSGAAEWSSNTLTINNAGHVNLVRANLGIIGDVTNTGQFYIAPQGGIVQVDGNFTVSGSSGAVIIQGGGMELIGDLDGTEANFTNNSTALNGTVVGASRYLVADRITNASGGVMTNSGRLEGRVAIVNNGTINSDTATSVLKGNVTNNYILNARGSIDGNLTNSAGQVTNVKGNLAQTGNLTNAGSLDVADGNLTGTSQLTNTSTITIGNGRTVSAADVKNNTGGSITLGSNSILTGTKIENSALITVGSGGTVSSTSTTTGEDLTNKAAGTIAFSGATGTANLSSGTGTIVNKGAINLNAGTVLVTGNLTDNGTIAIANDATFKTGSANQTIANAMTLAGTSTFDTNGFDATASGNITGAGGLTKTGLGNLTLDGTNTFSGASAINAGQLTLEGGNAMGDASALTVGAAGKLKVENNETIGSLAGAAGTETNLAANLTTGGNNSSTTYSGKIIGTGKLAKDGTGTMTLAGSNANTFSGGVDVNAGTLVASTNEQLGTGTVSVGVDSTLDIEAGTTQTVDGVSVSSDGTLNNSGALASNSKISNSGAIYNLDATSVIGGGITNNDVNAIIDNKGTINGGITNIRGTVQNDTAASVINGGLTNNRPSVVNNTGAINGGIDNRGTLNSNTATSVITGGIDNEGAANLQNQVSGEILNKSTDRHSGPFTITVTGDLVGNSTLLNKGTAQLHVKDGNFTGITTLTNQSTNAAGVQIDATRTLGANAVTNQVGSTIVNSGTLQSATVINNSGTITNNTGATANGGINNADIRSLVTNNGTINGGITQNFGTVNSLDAGSVINGGVNNSGYVNAQNQISGAIVNNAQHSFTDVTLSHAQANAAGTVTFGSDPTAPTLNLSAKSDGVAGGATGNGDVTVEIVFDATTAGSSYDQGSNTITVSFTGTSATIAEIRSAINDGDAGDVFTASAGIDTDEINAGINSLATLTGGRDSGTALIRVLADATGSAAQNKSVAIVNDNTITADMAVASIDSTTGNITVRVNGNVSYGDIAMAIDDLSGFNASVTSSMGDDLGYMSSIDTPPTASTLTNGVFNVEGNLVVDNTFTNVGHLNLNNGDLTGITTLTNSGDVVVQDGYTLQAGTVDSTAGKIDLGYDSTLEAGTLTNSSAINVYGEGDVIADGTITNNASGTIAFGMGSTAANEMSELRSDTNTIVNNGRIDVTNGILKTTGNLSGSGTIAMGDGTAFQTGNNNQTIANSMTLADDGSANFDTAGLDATVSGTISGDGDLYKVGAGNLTLSGTNTFTGSVEVDDGQLTLQGGNAIANSTAVRVYEGTLKVSSAETIGSLATLRGTQTVLDTTLTTGGNHASTSSSGVISGTAGLVKQGMGTMFLSGDTANSYAGGTTVSGGTLAASTNQQLGSGSVSVGTGATLTTGNSTTQTVAGVTNQGTVTLGNGATLNTGSSHFNNSGTVNVGTSASIVDTGAITNSGAINFSGGTATLSSGTNSITNTGNINLNAGTVLVKGNLTGSGSINMNNGTTLRSGNSNQQIANGIRVNTGTAIIDTNGNNVNLTGTIAGAGNLNKVGNGDLTWVGVNHGNAQVNSGTMITSTQNQMGHVQLSNGSGVIFDQNTSGTYSGNVTGNGTLTKTGSGSVTMTGNSVYSGGTNVVGGTLYVGSQGTGQVQSNVHVDNGGTLGGGGTIVGNVATQPGGRIAAGNSIGTLNITGNLNAAGSVVENEMNGTTGDLVNVTGTANLAGATLQNQFDPTASYTTRMYRAIDAAGGVTGRFASVSNPNAPSDLLISTYYTSTTANVVLTSLADATLASSTSTSLLNVGQDYTTTIMNQVNGDQFGGPGLVVGDVPTRAHRNAWFKGLGFFNDVDAVGSAPGYSANTGGGVVGIDQAFGQNTRLGIAGGYTITDLVMGNASRAKAEDNAARFNLYGTHSFEFATLSGVGGFAFHDLESERNLLGIGTALGEQSQNETSLNFQLTMNPIGEVHSLLPYVGIQWVQLSQDAYTETGTPGFDLAFDKATVDSTRPYIGLGYQYRIVSQSGLSAIPFLFSRYSHETNTDSNLSHFSLNDTNFTVAGVRPSRSIVSLGGGINAQFQQNMDWYVGYNVDLGDRGTNQNATGGLGFNF